MAIHYVRFLGSVSSLIPPNKKIQETSPKYTSKKIHLIPKNLPGTYTRYLLPARQPPKNAHAPNVRPPIMDQPGTWCHPNQQSPPTWRAVSRLEPWKVELPVWQVSHPGWGVEGHILCFRIVFPTLFFGGGKLGCLILWVFLWILHIFHNWSKLSMGLILVSFYTSFRSTSFFIPGPSLCHFFINSPESVGRSSCNAS